MAANWYLRNHRKIQYGDGKTESDMDKVKDYLQLAEMKWQTYIDFCREMKTVYNWTGGYGNLGGTVMGGSSTYNQRYGYR